MCLAKECSQIRRNRFWEHLLLVLMDYFYLCSQLWFAYGARSLTCGLAGCLALTASTFFTVFCKLFVFKVLMCFMAHSSFIVVDARLFIVFGH